MARRSREDGMPLPTDVGRALAENLADVQPQTSLRSVFISCKAPRRGIRPDLVSDVTRRACDRAGLPGSRAPVAAHVGHRDAASRSETGRHRPGASSPRSGHHRALREG